MHISVLQSCFPSYAVSLSADSLNWQEGKAQNYSLINSISKILEATGIFSRYIVKWSAVFVFVFEVKKIFTGFEGKAFKVNLKEIQSQDYPNIFKKN